MIDVSSNFTHISPPSVGFTTAYCIQKTRVLHISQRSSSEVLAQWSNHGLHRLGDVCGRSNPENAVPLTSNQGECHANTASCHNLEVSLKYCDILLRIPPDLLLRHLRKHFASVIGLVARTGTNRKQEHFM